MKRNYFMLISAMILLLALTGCSSDKGVKYTESMIKNEVSIKGERDFSIGNVDCKNLYGAGGNSYYLFDSEKDAIKAFETIKSEWIDYGCPVEETDVSINGIQNDVMDAVSIGYFYRTGNLIISTDDTSVGLDPEFGDALDEFYDQLRNHPDEFYAQFKDSHDSIQQTWP